MSEKYLTELEWLKVAKGHALKDAPLTRALAALDCGTKTGPQGRLSGLLPVSKTPC